MKKSIIILILLVSISLICFNTLAFAATPNFNIKSFIGSCLVKPDGSLWVWGNGQPTPVKIHGLSDVDRAFNEQLVMKKIRRYGTGKGTLTPEQAKSIR